jgi:deoxyhypusine synthase
MHLDQAQFQCCVGATLAVLGGGLRQWNRALVRRTVVDVMSATPELADMQAIGEIVEHFCPHPTPDLRGMRN